MKKKEDKTNMPIKIKVSLTRQHQKLLEYATKVTDDYSLIHFVYTDINSNIKIRLKEPINNWVVFNFNSKRGLAEILGLIEHFECHTKFGEADNQSNCEDESILIHLFFIYFSHSFPLCTVFQWCANKADYY